MENITSTWNYIYLQLLCFSFVFFLIITSILFYQLHPFLISFRIISLYNRGYSANFRMAWAKIMFNNNGISKARNILQDYWQSTLCPESIRIITGCALYLIKAVSRRGSFHVFFMTQYGNRLAIFRRNGRAMNRKRERRGNGEIY